MMALVGFIVLLAQAAPSAPECRSCPLLSKLAAALSDGHSEEALGYFDKRMPGYNALAASADALVAQYEVTASIDELDEKATDEEVTATVDWYEELTTKDELAHVTRRRERVRITERKQAGKWKITEMGPIDMMATPVTAMR